MAAVLFHSVQNGFGLVAGCFQCGAGNVALLRVLSDTVCGELATIT